MRFGNGQLVVMAILAIWPFSKCRKDGERTSNLMQKLVAECASGTQIKNLLYFGLSNDIGPGSVWRKSEANGYIAVRLLKPAELPQSDDVVKTGVPASCAGASVSAKALSLNASADNIAQLLSAQLGADLQRADSIRLTADRYRVDEVIEGEFNDMLSALQGANPVPGYYGDFNRTRMIVGRAVRVEGLTADLHFSSTAGTALTAKYPSGLDIGGSLKGTWKNGTVLSLASAQPVYVAVQMYRYDPATTGFQGPGDLLKPIPVTGSESVDLTKIGQPIP